MTATSDAVVERGSVDVSTAAVLLKLTPDPLAHGALGAVRSLGRLGIAVHVLDTGDWAPLRASRYVAGGAGIPLDGDAECVRHVVAYGGRFPTRPVLVAIGDVSALFLEKHAEELSKWYLLPRAPHGLASRLADKVAMASLCSHHSIATPRWLLPEDVDEAVEFAHDVGFPLMLKSVDPREIHWGQGEVSVRRVADLAALRGLLVDPSGRLRPNVMLQQFLAGGPENVWFFHGYFDSTATCLAGFVGQKLRENPPGAGPTVLGVCRDNPTVRTRAERLLSSLGYRGIVDAEFRYDARTDEYYLIDLNPRIGANFRLFVTDNGIDVVRAMYLDLTGAAVPSHLPPVGRKWWVESQDPVTWPTYFGSGRLPWTSLLPSLVGVREAAWWAIDDPQPFLTMLVFRAKDAKRWATARISAARATPRRRHARRLGPPPPARSEP